MSRKRLAAIAAIAVCAAAPALAQAPANASTSATPQEDPSKFFLFHQSGLTTDQVRGDLVYCIGLAYPILSMRDRMPQQGGLIGALINGRMAEIDRRRMRNAAMRKCMGLMGYTRYQMQEDAWNTIVNRGDIVMDNDSLVDPQVVERMVAFATSSEPAGRRLDP